jgi:hypothetical protein
VQTVFCARKTIFRCAEQLFRLQRIFKVNKATGFAACSTRQLITFSYLRKSAAVSFFLILRIIFFLFTPIAGGYSQAGFVARTNHLHL